MLRSALLVDDSRSARLVLSRLLQKHDFDVATAESGEQALAMLQTQTPDAIFIDYQMPGMDGLETISQIKRNPQLRHIPIIMCTSNDGDEYAVAARSFGAIEILSKPPSSDRLAAVIELLDARIAHNRTVAPAIAAPAAGGMVPAQELFREAAGGADARTGGGPPSASAAEIEEAIRQLVDQRIGQLQETLTADLNLFRDEFERDFKGRVDAAMQRVPNPITDELIESLMTRLGDLLSDELGKRVDGLQRAGTPDQQGLDALVIRQVREVAEGTVEAIATETATRLAREIAHDAAQQATEAVLDQTLTRQLANLDSIRRTFRQQGLLLLAGVAVLGAAAITLVLALAR